jgi:hypothetical protein
VKPISRPAKADLAPPVADAARADGAEASTTYEEAMPRNIVLCFDGTWNKPNAGATATNVHKLFERLPRSDAQLAWYDAGVGTAWQTRLRGGIAGYGLSKNITQGYAWLGKQYRERDRIFLVGFSRGAYSARSLAGLLRKCWLPRVSSDDVVERAYSLYRRRDRSADEPDVEAFRREHGRAVEIHCLAVWDTVGSLGIPGGLFRKLDRELWGFHDTRLSRIVRSAFHAVAIDEHRSQYDATLWDATATEGQVVEQRWFVGAHGNVGGGYPDARLSDIALEWIVERVRGCGLIVADRSQPLPSDAYAGRLHDSYQEFVGWIYRLFNRRRPRRIPLERYAPTAMTVDGSAVARLQEAKLAYRPENLIHGIARRERAGGAIAV